MKNYKIAITIEFPHHTEYVIWEPEMLGHLMYNGINIEDIFYNIEKNGFKDPPVHVLIELYEDPKIEQITQKMNDKEVLMQILIGTKILPIRSF